MTAAIDYSIWACCFARGSMPLDFVGGSPVCSNQGVVEIPFVYSVISSAPCAGHRRLIVADTGFAGGESMTGRKFANFETPAMVLGKLGFTPEDVATVVLTHMHFDHAGNIDAFPNAEIIVQRTEYESWQGVLAAIPEQRRSRQLWELSSLEPNDFKVFDRAADAGRVRFADGDAEIAPGIQCKLAAEAHTFGSQWVRVDTPDGVYIIASDCAYSYAAIERMWPPAYTQGNPWNMLKTFERMRELARGDLSRIVPGHDMGLFARNVSWIDGLNPIAEIHLASGERSRRK
ncbi:MAG: N-acyl homoserine lactonase family protein [Candidatus Binataceae bacterium]